MRILVLYGTSEGQTQKIAGFIAERLKQLNHDTELLNVTRQSVNMDTTRFDAVILAARVHGGQHHRGTVSFVARQKAALEAMPNAFVSVSMSAAHHLPDDEGRLAEYKRQFIESTAWTPERFYEVAGARLYTRHGPLTRWILGIVDRHRYDTNVDHEFTDWAALATFVTEWAEDAERRLKKLSAARRGSD